MGTVISHNLYCDIINPFPRETGTRTRLRFTTLAPYLSLVLEEGGAFLTICSDTHVFRFVRQAGGVVRGLRNAEFVLKAGKGRVVCGHERIVTELCEALATADDKTTL